MSGSSSHGSQVQAAGQCRNSHKSMGAQLAQMALPRICLLDAIGEWPAPREAVKAALQMRPTYEPFLSLIYSFHGASGSCGWCLRTVGRALCYTQQICPRTHPVCRSLLESIQDNEKISAGVSLIHMCIQASLQNQTSSIGCHGRASNRSVPPGRIGCIHEAGIQVES